MTLVVGAEREGLPDDVRRRVRRGRPHPDRLGVAERRDGGDGRAVRGLGSRDDRPHRSSCRTRPRGGDRRGRPAPTSSRTRACATSAARPSCRNLLRGVAQLPPEERGAVGRAANEARRALEAAIEAPPRPSSSAPSSTRGWPPTCVDVTLPGSPAQPVGRLHLLTAHAARARGHLPRPRLPRRRGAGGRHRLLQLRRAQPRRRAPGAAGVGHVLRRRRHRAAHAHLADAGARDGGRSRRRSTSSSPGARYRRDNDAHAHAAVPPGRGPGGRRGHHARPTSRARCSRSRAAIFGDEREVRLRPHFFPFTEPSVELDVSCFNCDDGFLRDGSRCPLCKGEGWIELLGAGEVDPNVFEYVREYGYDPERHQGFALGMGIERIAVLKYGVPDLRLLVRQRPALPGAVRLMLLPLALAQRLLRPRARRRRARGAADDDRHEGRARLRARRHRARELRRRPRADAPSATRTPTG